MHLHIALHTDLHASHHLLALLSGGAKEYVVFPADAVTRERLRYNDLGGRFEAAVARDYPIIFGTLFIFGLIGLLVGILSDLMYVVVDPRIDFEKREG